MSAASSIETLEMRIAYQDDTIDQLSDMVYAQSRVLARLTQRCEQLESRIAGLAEGGDANEIDETPPHY
tara:strand:+ start:544 stop:750 length:207 start_codon:yes stop_codon:yes gene_type:complete